MRVEIGGTAPGTADLVAAATSYGHFTAMQVRDGRVRGLGYHLDRLAASTREVFGSELDTDLVRSYVRRLVAGQGALSVRVIIFSRSSPHDPAMAPEILVRTAPPASPVATPMRLRSVSYQRDLPHVKHLGGFGLTQHSRAAALAGYDDAVFLAADGRISEATIWNVGFLRDGTIVWPEAPVLPGITYLVIEEQLRKAGVPQETRPVYPAELPEFDAMFVTNSATVGRPVASVDDVPLRISPSATELLTTAYEAAPWDEI